MWAYCPPEPPLLRASPCASFHSLPTPWGVAPNPTFATWQGCRWPLRFASLYLPPCPSVGSLQGHQVLSRHKPLRYLFHGHLTPFPFKWSWCQGRKRKPQLSERSESERVSISGAAVPLMPTQRPSLWLWSWRRRERSDRLNQLPSPSAARVGRQRAQRGARGKAP